MRTHTAWLDLTLWTEGPAGPQQLITMSGLASGFHFHFPFSLIGSQAGAAHTQRMKSPPRVTAQDQRLLRLGSQNCPDSAMQQKGITKGEAWAPPPHSDVRLSSHPE